jgi:hypothetical protein
LVQLAIANARVIDWAMVKSLFFPI